MTTQPPHGDMGAIRSTATALVHGRNRPSSPVIREKKKKERKKKKEISRRRVAVQPPHGGDMDANAQRVLPWFTVSVPSQPPVVSRLSPNGRLHYSARSTAPLAGHDRAAVSPQHRTHPLPQ